MLRQRHRGVLESFRLQRARAKAWSPVTALPKPRYCLGSWEEGGGRMRSKLSSPCRRWGISSLESSRLGVDVPPC